MAEAALPRTARPPLWRDVRFLRIAGQALFLVVVGIVLREMYLNAAFQLGQRGTEFGYGFLDTRAGFGIKEHVVSYSPNHPFVRAFLVGFTNALFLAFVGIVIATLLGLIIGVARLSPNWLLRKITQVYVEVFRNTPLLVQVIFWYVAVILSIPRIQESLSLFDIAYLSNRGAVIPAVRSQEDFGTWALVLLLGVIAAAAVSRWRTRVNERTGQPSYRVLSALGVVLAFAVIGYVALGRPFAIQTPEVARFGYEGGMKMSPEFAGILLGLVIYTAAFIAEIVRGSILAVPKGQKEAAESLGLTPAQQLRLVVLPQALRVAIPAINNQYLNLWKNTSLAFAIGFPELINISGTIINQAGHELQVFSLVVVTYLLTSLAVSLLMNVANRAVALKGVSV